MALLKLWIEEGFTACRLCEDICPGVFKMENDSIVIERVNCFDYEEGIQETTENCLVEVI